MEADYPAWYKSLNLVHISVIPFMSQILWINSLVLNTQLPEEYNFLYAEFCRAVVFRNNVTPYSSDLQGGP